MVEREEAHLRPGDHKCSWTLLLIPEKTEQLFNPYMSVHDFLALYFILRKSSASQAAELRPICRLALAHFPCAHGSLVDS